MLEQKIKLDDNEKVNFSKKDKGFVALDIWLNKEIGHLYSEKNGVQFICPFSDKMLNKFVSKSLHEEIKRDYLIPVFSINHNFREEALKGLFGEKKASGLKAWKSTSDMRFLKTISFDGIYGNYKIRNSTNGKKYAFTTSELYSGGLYEVGTGGHEFSIIGTTPIIKGLYSQKKSIANGIKSFFNLKELLIQLQKIKEEAKLKNISNFDFGEGPDNNDSVEVFKSIYGTGFQQKNVIAFQINDPEIDKKVMDLFYKHLVNPFNFHIEKNEENNEDNFVEDELKDLNFEGDEGDVFSEMQMITETAEKEKKGFLDRLFGN